MGDAETPIGKKRVKTLVQQSAKITREISEAAHDLEIELVRFNMSYSPEIGQ